MTKVGKEKHTKEKRSNGVALKLLCVAIPAAALVIVLTLVLYPSARAKRERDAIARELGELAIASDGSATVSKLFYNDFGLSDESSEWRLEGSRAADLAAMLSEALGKAKYSGKTDSPGGNWDTRLRFTSSDGGSITLYLCDDGRLYFVRGMTRFYFTPKQKLTLPELD